MNVLAMDINWDWILRFTPESLVFGERKMPNFKNAKTGEEIPMTGKVKLEDVLQLLTGNSPSGRLL